MGVQEWIMQAGQGHAFFLAYVVSALLLLVFLKKRRVGFVLPALLMTAVIVNPVFFRLWDRMGLYAYWRILWVVPVIPMCAAVPAMAAEKTGKIPLKSAAALAAAVIMAVTGTFLYTHKNGNFVIPSGNAAKLPDEAVRVSDVLLEHSEHPRAVVEYPLCVYIRQYTGSIDLLYGRDIEGYILKASDDAKSVHRTLNDRQSSLDGVAEIMLNDGYEYLVLKDADRTAYLESSAFELVDRVADYGIYRVHGKPTVVRERNGFGQVLSETRVDENGEKVNGADGVCRTVWAYDDNGQRVYEFRTDAQGNPVQDGDGFCGFEQTLDQSDRIVMFRTLGPDGKAAANSLGYAEYRRVYRNGRLVQESYFDAQGLPVIRSDKLYASITQEWDGSLITAEHYFDAEGKPVLSPAGFASCRSRYEGRNLIGESYFGTDGKPVLIPGGYASVQFVRDGKGKITRESLFGTEGQPVCGNGGWAVREVEYDSSQRIICERFFKEDGTPTVTGRGYAQVSRSWNESGGLTRETYLGADGAPLLQSAGYAGIEQTYDENGELCSRIYLDADGRPVTRTDGYAEVRWTLEDGVREACFLDAQGNAVPMEGLNLAMDVHAGPDGWSEWISPRRNVGNYTTSIGRMNLGRKQAGDVYTCRVEIEFEGVSASGDHAFGFRTQGSADGAWNLGNGWNGLASLTEVPGDGVMVFTDTFTVTESMQDVSWFSLGFRCDFWNSGRFRVRLVKVETGDAATDWTPGV